MRACLVEPPPTRVSHPRTAKIAPYGALKARSGDAKRGRGAGSPRLGALFVLDPIVLAAHVEAQQAQCVEHHQEGRPLVNKDHRPHFHSQ